MKNLPPTPVKTLERAYDIADAEGLQYVYLGNVPGHPGENTYCPGCGRKVIGRLGFTIQSIEIKKGACGHDIAGVWED